MLALMLGLLVIALAGGVWLVLRWRAAQRKKSDERATAMLAMLREHVASRTRDAAPVAAPAVAARAPALLTRKPRLLGKEHNMAYLLLKAGLPDHTVFANLCLADLIEVVRDAPPAEAARHARLLSEQRVDFVICTRSLEIVAAVSLDAAAEAAERVSANLRAAGIRHLRLASGALPRRDELRAQLGA